MVLLLGSKSFASTISKGKQQLDVVNLITDKGGPKIESQASNTNLVLITDGTPVEGNCCATCTVSVNLGIVSGSYTWCCRPCPPTPPLTGAPTD